MSNSTTYKGNLPSERKNLDDTMVAKKKLASELLKKN
jgi:hypothetical protein